MTADRPAAPALEVRDLVAGYGDSSVLHGVSLTLEPGRIAVLLGRNGVGKSTLVRCLAGLLPVRSGSVALLGQEVTNRPAHAVADRGLGVMPQGKRMFPSLTVAENLDLGRLTRQRRTKRGGDPELAWSTERVLELFPVFADRMKTRAGSLSGGEQQMLALARAMVGGPRVLVLDEPSEALSPARVSELGRLLDGLRGQGLPILLVEQNVSFACELADVVRVMDKGQIVAERRGAEIADDRDLIASLLSI
jgi:ABC-type branched-subunit amino acid transport system ATPase component